MKISFFFLEVFKIRKSQKYAKLLEPGIHGVNLKGMAVFERDWLYRKAQGGHWRLYTICILP